MIELQYDLAFFKELIEDEARIDDNGNTDGCAHFFLYPFNEDKSNWKLQIYVQSNSVFSPNKVVFEPKLVAQNAIPDLSLVELERILQIIVEAFEPDVAYISSAEFNKAMRHHYEGRHGRYGWLTYYRDFDRLLRDSLPPPFLDEGKYLRLDRGPIDPGIFDRVPHARFDFPKMLAKYCLDPEVASRFVEEAAGEETPVPAPPGLPSDSDAVASEQAPKAAVAHSRSHWNGLRIALPSCPNDEALTKTRIRLRGIMMKLFGVEVGDAEMGLPPSTLAPDEIALTEMIMEIEDGFKIGLTDFDLSRVQTGDDLAVVVQCLVVGGEVPIPELAADATAAQRAVALGNCRVALELLGLEPNQLGERLGVETCLPCTLRGYHGEWLRRSLRSPWLADRTELFERVTAVVNALDSLAPAEQQCTQGIQADGLARPGWSAVRSSAREALNLIGVEEVG